MTTINIYTLKFPKNHHFLTNFDWTVFFLGGGRWNREIR